MAKNFRKNRVTKSTLDKINQDLKALAATPADDFSAKETVRKSLPNIDKALENGHTMAKVNEALAKRGLHITTSTLTSYVHTARREANALERDLAPESQEDETSDNETISSAADRGEGGLKPTINLVPIDEAEDPFSDTDFPNEVPRSPDDDIIDRIFEERHRNKLHIQDDDE